MPRRIDNVENFLREYTYSHNRKEFGDVWKSFYQTRIKEESMAEKKGGLKVFIWLFCFLLVVGAGWFAITKFSAVQLKGKIDSGEAIIVTMTVGQVETMKLNAKEWNELYSDDTLEMGDIVKTGSKSYCELQMVNKGMFRVESDTELAIKSLISPDGKLDAKMKLTKGEVAIKPKKLAEGEVFQVETSSAVAAVRGTTFSITVDDQGSTKVAVSEGKVAVTPKVTAIDKAEQKGQISKDSVDALKEEIVKPVEVVPGEEMVLDQKKLEKMDKAIEKAIDEVSKEKGPITAEKMIASKAEISGAIITKAMADVAEGELDVSAKEVVNAFSISASVVTKQELSEESKKKLEQVSEEKIVKDIEQLAKLTINTTPAGAEIYLNDEFLGTSPVQKMVKKDQTFNVMIVKEGFENYNGTVSAGASANVELKVEQQAVAVAPETNVIETPAATNALPTLDPEKPAVDKPKIDKPKVDKPKVDKPKIDKPKVDKPVIDKPEVDKPKGPKSGDLIWNKPISAPLAAGSLNDPLYFQGKIYATAGDKLYILSLEGELIKTVSVQPAGQTLTRPSEGNGLILVNSDKGTVYAFKPNGDMAWKSEASAPAFPAASPIGSGGVVAVPTMEKGMQIFDKNGSFKTSVVSSEIIFSTPIILKNGTLLVYANDTGDVIGYDIPSKTKLWSQAFGLKRIVFPFVGNDSVVVILERATGILLGFSPEGGKELWRTTISDLKNTEVNPVYDEGYVILVNKDMDTVFAVKASSGSKVLEKNVKSKITGKPYISKKVVYIGTADGQVIGWDLSTKKEVMKYKPEEGGAEVSIIVAEGDNVYAVDEGEMKKIKN